MHLETVESDAELVVALHGQLVVGTRQTFHEAVTARITAGVRRVVIDCRETAYIDTTGLATLAALARQLGEQGGSVRAVGMADALRAACALARLDGLLSHYPSLEAALGVDVSEPADGPARAADA